MGNDFSSYGDYGAAAQPVSPNVAAAGLVFVGGMLLFMAVIFLIIYIYMSVCLMKMAHKTNTPNAWLAWIPIINVILMLQIAKKPLWWIILFFIPLVNIVIGIMVCMAIAKALGKPEWIGILTIVPIVNIIIPGYLAFSKNEAPQTPPVAPTSPPPAPPVTPIA